MTDPAIMLAWLDGRIASTQTWLDTHWPGTKREWPEHDCADKQTNLERYQEIRIAYAKALERKRAAE